MKRFLITLAAVAAIFGNASARGTLVDGGTSLVDAGKKDLLNTWLVDICGANGTGNNCQIYKGPDPKNNPGDTYFVSVNPYWKGEPFDGLVWHYNNVYEQINYGVTNIEKVTKSVETYTGKFFIHQAQNANKFFFITRREKIKDAGTLNYMRHYAFRWYDEWSYAESEDNSWNDLKPSYDALKEGAPFFAPHNCNSSLENNHYVTLNARDDYKTPGYNFPIFFFLPNNTAEANPYMFFYTAWLNNGTATQKTGEVAEGTNGYQVNLSWSTVFDKYASQVTATTYEGMKEHYIVERSYDQVNWETIEGINDVKENAMTTTSSKQTCDTNLKAFDETTAKTGYTVYYRLTSVVMNNDDEELARRTAEKIVEVVIPGSSAFTLTLGEGSTSEYTAGSYDNGTYTDGYNTISDVLKVSASAGQGSTTIAAGATLSLIRTNAAGEATTVATATASSATTVDALIAQMTTGGNVTVKMENVAGDEANAQYVLSLTQGDETVTSNTVNMIRGHIEMAVSKIQRSGTPDAETCAANELYESEIKFKPAYAGIGTGYTIYGNGEAVMILVDNGDQTYKAENIAEPLKANAEGYIVVPMSTEGAAISAGETGEANNDPNVYYTVVSYDKAGNTFGRSAQSTGFTGTHDELAVGFEQNSNSVRVGYSYNTIYVNSTLSWTKNTDDDVIRYEIWRMQEPAEFEEAATDGAAATSTYAKVADVDGSILTYNDVATYAREKQTTGQTQGNVPTNRELRPTYYYIKAILAEGEESNVNTKNSAPIVFTEIPEGAIYTGVTKVAADEANVTVEGGVITVTGANGLVEVYNANGQVVAKAQANGSAEIEASHLNGVYFVKVAGNNATKILIK